MPQDFLAKKAILGITHMADCCLHQGELAAWRKHMRMPQCDISQPTPREESYVQARVLRSSKSPALGQGRILLRAPR